MRACLASVPILLVVCLVDACNKENVGVVEGPPLKIAPPASVSSPGADAALPPIVGAPAGPQPDAGAPKAESRAPQTNPVRASFVDVTAKGTELKFTACEQLTIALVKGRASAFGEQLADGDALVARSAGTSTLKGDGLAVVATVQPPQCDAGGATKLVKKVPASAAPELTWAGGAMRARLDLEADASPNAYTGRLEGTEPVAEHVHPDAWEILCAVDAKGTFVLDGKEQRLGARQIVVVPPGTKHEWRPDPNSKLAGVQFYAPPGPEQRFKKLSADDAARRKALHEQTEKLQKDMMDALADGGAKDGVPARVGKKR
jgi:quercetin dioxygenase-like cupin family protein